MITGVNEGEAGVKVRAAEGPAEAKTEVKVGGEVSAEATGHRRRQGRVMCLAVVQDLPSVHAVVAYHQTVWMQKQQVENIIDE